VNGPGRTLQLAPTVGAGSNAGIVSVWDWFMAVAVVLFGQWCVCACVCVCVLLGVVLGMQQAVGFLGVPVTMLWEPAVGVAGVELIFFAVFCSLAETWHWNHGWVQGPHSEHRRI